MKKRAHIIGITAVVLTVLACVSCQPIVDANPSTGNGTPYDPDGLISSMAITGEKTVEITFKEKISMTGTTKILAQCFTVYNGKIESNIAGASAVLLSNNTILQITLAEGLPGSINNLTWTLDYKKDSGSYLETESGKTRMSSFYDKPLPLELPPLTVMIPAPKANKLFTIIFNRKLKNITAININYTDYFSIALNPSQAVEAVSTDNAGTITVTLSSSLTEGQKITITFVQNMEDIFGHSIPAGTIITSAATVAFSPP